MADPLALVVADAASRAVEVVGLPEAALNLAECVVYLATAPKSNRVTVALGRAMDDVRSAIRGEVPNHLRDGHSPNAARPARAEPRTAIPTTTPAAGSTSSTGPTSWRATSTTSPRTTAPRPSWPSGSSATLRRPSQPPIRLVATPDPGPTSPVDRFGRCAHPSRPELMDANQLRSSFLGVLRGPRPPPGAVGQPGAARPLGHVHDRRHGPVQALLHPARTSRRGPGPPRCRSASGPSTSTTSGARPATTPSSRCSATSASATTSRSGPSPRLGVRHRGPRPRPRPAVGHRARRPTTRPARSGWRRRRSPAERIQRLGEDNFWEMGETGPVRAVLGDLLRQGRGLRRRRRPDGRGRGALRRVLEPGVHAVQPAGRRHAGRPARQEHRHRHGPRADARGASRGSTPIFDTDAFRPMIETAERLLGARYGADARHRRRPPQAGRPRPGHDHARRRRGAARPTTAAATCCAGSSAGPSWRPAASASTTPVTGRWPRRRSS